MKSKRLTKEKVSTKSLILLQAREITNSIGVVDFRFDALSKALGISPGNITYHFARKEDIVVALWGECIDKMAEIDENFFIAPLDITQFYNLLASAATLLFQYRGIVNFVLSDLSAMRLNRHKLLSIFLFAKRRIRAKIRELEKRGYLVFFEEAKLLDRVVDGQMIAILWWTNHAVFTEHKIFSFQVSYYGKVALSRLAPYVTPLGNEQLKRILSNER